jgi:hypothetical protein
MEICLNDARQDPKKYRFLYPCDFDKEIAPRLSSMKGGRRLPLRRAGTSTTELLDRLVSAIVRLAIVFSLHCAGKSTKVNVCQGGEVNQLISK